MKTVQLTCEICTKQFTRPLKRHMYNIMRLNRNHFYCSNCKQPKRAEHPCAAACGQETTNPKFCSLICSAQINNKLKPKRQLRGACFGCSKRIRASRKYCLICLKQYRPRVDYGAFTLQELLQKGTRNAYHTCVRQHANRVAENAGLLSACKVCGYDFYVECCHIKPVSKFPKSTPLSVVNDKGNLVGLCANHHIEFDKHHIMLP